MTPCQLWTGPFTARGFPKAYVNGHYTAPHRVALERELGEPLGSRVVRATCGDRRCTEPSHLQAVDRSSMQLAGDEPAATNQHSGRRGVYRHHTRWRAQVRVKGRIVTVGVYDSLDEADQAARRARRLARE